MTIANSLEEELLLAARRANVERLVVGAAIIQAGRVLLLKRRQDDFLGGMFEMPGGVVEVGETLNQGLAREIKEETGLNIRKVVAYLGFFEYVSGGGLLTRQFNFQVSVAAPYAVELTEHDDFVWAEPREMACLAISDDTRDVIKNLLQVRG